MASLLMGHGGQISGEKVIVPAGFSIRFLTDNGQSLPFYNGVGLMLNYDTLVDGGFSLYGPYDAGDEVDNHIIGPLESFTRAWYAQVDPENGTCFYAGEHFDENKLCNDPAQCLENARQRAGEDATPEEIRAAVVHTCGGLFSITWNDPDLVWVSCRYVPGQGSQRTLGDQGNVAFADFADEAVQQLATLGPEGFATFYDALDDEQKSIVLSKVPVLKWLWQRTGRYHLTENGEESFYAFCNGLEDKRERDWTLEAADLKAAYDNGKVIREAREYLKSAGAEAFAAWFRDIDPYYQSLITADSEMSTALADRNRAAGEVGGAVPEMAWDDVDWSSVTRINEAIVKDLDEGGQVPYWLVKDGLLIGTEQPLTYRRLFEHLRGADSADGNHPTGYITMKSKGSLTSTGSISVTDCDDPVVFKAAIRQFSKKDVKFV
jgi:hypothetical protein